MKNKSLIFAICLLFICSCFAFAEDAPVKGKIGTGFTGYGSNDYKGKIAEYRSDDSNVNLKGELSGEDGKSDFDFSADYIGTDDMKASGKINVNRYFKINGSYSKFIHRLDHDELFSHYIKKPTNLKDYPFTIQKDIDGDGVKETLQGFPVVAPAPLSAPTKPGSPMTWYDVIKSQATAKGLTGLTFDDTNKTITMKSTDGQNVTTDTAILSNLYPFYGDIAAFEEHGPKGWQYTDHNVGKDYNIKRELTKTDLKLALPFFPAVSIHAKYRNERRDGYRQAMGMSAHCGTCHIQSFSKKINEENTAYSLGAAVNTSNVNFTYTHTWQHFSRNDSNLSYFYSLTHRPPVDDPDTDGYGFPKNKDLGNRVRFQNQEMPFARTPKTSKNIDEAKLRVNLAKSTDFYSSFTSIRTTDTDRTEVLNKDLDSDYTGILGRLSTNALRNLNLTLSYKHYTINSDDIYVPDSVGTTTTPTGWGTEAFKDSAVDFGYNRKSEIDRDVDELNLGINYFLSSLISVKGEISYKQIDRDNPLQVFENPTFDATSGNAGTVVLDEYDYGDTEKTDVNLSFYLYPSIKLHGMFAFKYTNIDDPFNNPRGKGEKDKLLDSVLTPIIVGPKVDVTKGVPDVPGALVYGKGAADNTGTYNVVKLTAPLTIGTKTFPAGMLIETGDGTVPVNVEGMATGSTYLEYFRPFNRMEDGVATPTDAYTLKMNFDWNLSPKFSVSPTISYSDEDNNNTDWERKTWNAGLNIAFIPSEKFNMFLAYNYLNQKTKTDVYYSFFNG